MNPKAKGDRAETRAKKELETAGFLVERAHGIPVWVAPGRCISKHHDFWSVFDLVGLRHDAIRFVQVTAADDHLKEKRDRIDDLEDYLPKMRGVSFELWYWMERKGWRKWVRYGGPCKWVETTTR